MATIQELKALNAEEQQFLAEVATTQAEVKVFTEQVNTTLEKLTATLGKQITRENLPEKLKKGEPGLVD